MDDITLNLIVFVIIGLIGGGIFLIVRRKQRGKEQAILQLAAEQGWTAESIREPLAWGMRLKSKKWTFETLSRSNGRETAPGSTDIDMSTIWQTDAIAGSTLLIGVRTSQVNLGSLGNTLTHQVLRMALGEYAEGLNEVQTGSEAFQKRYMVWAQDPAEADKLLNPVVEFALLNWEGAPLVIKRTPQILSIELHGVHMNNIDQIRALIHIGELLIAKGS